MRFPKWFNPIVECLLGSPAATKGSKKPTKAFKLAAKALMLRCHYYCPTFELSYLLQVNFHESYMNCLFTPWIDSKIIASISTKARHSLITRLDVMITDKFGRKDFSFFLFSTKTISDHNNWSRNQLQLVFLAKIKAIIVKNIFNWTINKKVVHNSQTIICHFLD